MKSSVQVTTASLSLAALDSLAVPDLVAFVASDERPLRGLAGFADWRMCGDLTAQLKAGRFSGRAGEALLTVPSGRLPVQRIFVFGIGPSASARPEGFLEASFAAVARAGGTAIATQLPGQGDRMRALADAAAAAGIRQLVVLENGEPAPARVMGGAGHTIAGRPLARS